MMTTDFTKLCSRDEKVRGLLSDKDGILKIFLSTVPLNTPAPYVTYQMINGTPFNTFGERIPAERITLQIDVYASTYKASQDITDAIIHAIELKAHVSRYNLNLKDIDTGNYRTSFDVDFINFR